MSHIAVRRKQITDQINSVASSCGHKPAKTELIAVSKGQSDQSIEALWQAGHRQFGENRVDEAERHWQIKRSQNEGFQLHLIGHLQGNKAERAIVLFDVIETLDSLKLANKLDTAMAKLGRFPQIMVQVNTGEEPQKSGVLPQALAGFLQQIADETNIKVCGLMCIPPQGDEPGLHFALLAKLAAQNNLSKLSMGMSADFETAVRFGATSVRVGSALFGSRQSSG